MEETQKSGSLWAWVRAMVASGKSGKRGDLIVLSSEVGVPGMPVQVGGFPTQNERNSTALNMSCKEPCQGVISVPGRLLLVPGTCSIRTSDILWQEWVGITGAAAHVLGSVRFFRKCSINPFWHLIVNRLLYVVCLWEHLIRKTSDFSSLESSH